MLIALEGIDGSGKTTVATALRGEYPEATHTAEPTDSWYGEAVHRSINLKDADPLAELFLYTADHAAHLTRTIEPAIETDGLVITDRYVDSRFAYQGAALQGIVPNPLGFVQQIHQPWSRLPDVTLYLDVDPATAVERSDAANKFEQVSFLEKVRANYDEVMEADPDRFIRIDASRSVEEVIDTAKTAIGHRVSGL